MTPTSTRAPTFNNQAPNPPAKPDSSLIGDVRQLLDGAGTLMRQELELLRSEARQQADRYAKGLAALGVGAAIASAGLVVLILSLGMALTATLNAAELDPAISAWLGPMVVATVVLIIGGALIAGAKNRLSEPPRLTKSLEEAERTAAWAKEKV